MTSSDLEPVARFFSGYFQEDSVRDDFDWESVVLLFRDVEPSQIVRRTQTALQAALDRMSEPELIDLLFGSTRLSFYDPRPEGWTSRAWLEEIIHLLAGGSPGYSDRAQVSHARRKAAAIASGALAGTTDPIVAARELAALRFVVAVPEDDSDFTCFVAVASETDSLPVGPERAQWSAEALFRLQPQVEKAQAWATTQCHEAFGNVARRFGGAA